MMACSDREQHVYPVSFAFSREGLVPSLPIPTGTHGNSLYPVVYWLCIRRSATFNVVDRLIQSQ